VSWGLLISRDGRVIVHAADTGTAVVDENVRIPRIRAAPHKLAVDYSHWNLEAQATTISF